MTNHFHVADTQPEKGQATVKSYIFGFVASIVLTLAAFYLVVNHTLSSQYLYISVAVLAIIQLLVQVVCFLRINSGAKKDNWNLISLLFTLIIIFILVGGSLWIMYNLNYNMVH